MSTPTLTQSELKAIINGMVHQKFDQCSSPTVIMNRAVRFVMGDIDLRSSKRYTALSPNMFDTNYDYTAPTDLKGEKIIDLRKQVNRSPFERWSLVDDKDFDRKKGICPYRIAIRDENYSKVLRADGVNGATSIVLNNLNSLTGNGTWTASGDASNITLDSVDFISGASFNFDTATGATTAILSTSNMTAVDLSDYDEQGSVFMYVFVPDTFTIASITNFILRWGNDSSNYWSKTVTTANDGLAFKAGWNLLRFDWSSATETGTVTPATIDYLHFTVTKSGAQAADTDWRIDEILFKKGDLYEVVYYSKYGWMTSALAYIEESTTTTDLLVADTDEMEMIANKGAEYASQELKEFTEVPYFKTQYEELKDEYESNYPSEALKKSRNYGSLPNLRRY
jgi:hypothetical protein